MTIIQIEKILTWLLVISLSLLQSSLTSINWLWIVVIYLGYKKRWISIFMVGFILDLVSGSRLGLSSLKFLLGGLVVSLVKIYWPLRHKQQLKLNLD